jgi:sugar transferase (PEP-CTERM/EpsH1 system associated)
MAIRILHVVEAIGVGGGVENGIANLIERMDASHFEHVLCGVFRLGPQIERYPADRVRLVCVEQKLKRFAIQVRPLAKTIRALQPDIVHSRNWGALEAAVAARWAGSYSVIHSEHGVEMNPSAEPRRRRWARRFVFGLADRVFSVSHQLKDSLVRSTGFPAHRIDVIHNGVDTKRFRPDKEAGLRFRQELGISEEEFCVGCVGRLNRIKDYPTLLRAAESLSVLHGAWRLLIAGGGEERSNLEELVRSTPALEGRVHFLGATSRITEFLNAIDVYALPSICEGISNSLLEAMASGLPAIVSDTGGNPEVVVDRESGLLFPVGDSRRLAEHLVELYRGPELRQRFGQQAIRRVKEEFALDSMVRKYEEMYQGLATGRAAGHASMEKIARNTEPPAEERKALMYVRNLRNL